MTYVSPFSDAFVITRVRELRNVDLAIDWHYPVSLYAILMQPVPVPNPAPLGP